MLSLLWFIITHPVDVLDCVLCVCKDLRSYVSGRGNERPRHMTLSQRLDQHKAKTQKMR